MISVKQVARRLVDADERLALLAGRRAVDALGDELGVAEDGVERRAQLVRDVGEELGLEPVHLLQLIALLDQRRVALGQLAREVLERAVGARVRHRDGQLAGGARGEVDGLARRLDEHDGALGLAAEEHRHDGALRLDDRLAGRQRRVRRASAPKVATPSPPRFAANCSSNSSASSLVKRIAAARRVGGGEQRRQRVVEQPLELLAFVRGVEHRGELGRAADLVGAAQRPRPRGCG